jgi:hypothetical protein
MALLVAEMSEKQLYEAGRRMGRTLRDVAMQRRLDTSRTEDVHAALKIVEDFGWGRLEMQEARIMVTGCFLPQAIMHGYLETGLSMSLKRLDTTDDIILFELGSAIPARAT